MPADSQPPQPERIDIDLYCPKCHYPLRHLTSNRCPECGLPLDFIDSQESRIPWVRTRGIGKVWGYVATTLCMMFAPKRIFREFYRPMSQVAARRYRWTTLPIVFVALVAMLADVLAHRDILQFDYHPSPRAGDLQNHDSPFEDTLPGDWAITLGWMPVIGSLIGLALGLFSAIFVFAMMPTTIVESSALPPALRRRARALSDFVAGALNFIAVAVVAVYAALTSDLYYVDEYSGKNLPLYGSAVIFGMVLFWFMHFRLAWFVHRRIGAALISVACTIIASLLTATMSFFILLFGCIYLALIIASAWR